MGRLNEWSENEGLLLEKRCCIQHCPVLWRLMKRSGMQTSNKSNYNHDVKGKARSWTTGIVFLEGKDISVTKVSSVL